MLGIDVVDVDRLGAVLARSPRLVQRLFTKPEQAYCEQAHNPVVHLAGTLAAKEATMKALGLGPLVAWASRIEITRDVSGAPRVRLLGKAQMDEVVISISHDGPVAVAVALRQVSPPLP